MEEEQKGEGSPELQTRLLPEPTEDTMNETEIRERTRESEDIPGGEAEEPNGSKDAKGKPKCCSACLSTQERWIKLGNFLGYLGLVISLVISALLYPDNNLFTLNDPTVSICMYNYLVVACWSIVLATQGFFACLPMCYQTEKFDELVTQRIYIWYIVCTILMIWYLPLFFKSREDVVPAIFAFVCILAIKGVTLRLLYKRIKYADEGQYYVGYVEFMCLHLMNSITCAWYTYLSLFSGLKLLRSITRKFEGDNDLLCILCQLVLFAEATIYLAYYKDVFFMVMVCGEIFGIGWLIYDSNIFAFPVILIIAGAGFILLTVLKHRERVVYMKYALRIAKLADAAQKQQESFSSDSESSSDIEPLPAPDFKSRSVVEQPKGPAKVSYPNMRETIIVSSSNRLK